MTTAHRLDVQRRAWLLTLASGAVQLPAIVATQGSGYGLIDFELAGTEIRAERMLAAWSGTTEILVALSLVADLAFVIGWTLLLSNACRGTAQAVSRESPVRVLGSALAAAVVGAAVLDLVQDLVLLAVLQGHTSQPLPRIAWFTATLVIPVVLTATAFALATIRLRRSAEPLLPG